LGCTYHLDIQCAAVLSSFVGNQGGRYKRKIAYWKKGSAEAAPKSCTIIPLHPGAVTDSERRPRIPRWDSIAGHMQNTPNNPKTPGKENPRVIIACRVMKLEMDALAAGHPGLELRYLDQNMHEKPAQMPGVIQEEIDKAEPYAGQIVLGYGLCSNGIEGIKAPRQGLIIPRVHDCIALFIGSREGYDEVFRQHPGTYYLTPGWVEDRKDPLGYMESTYLPKMGREKAEWGIREELKNYTRIVLIDTQSADMAPLRAIARENARFLDKTYVELTGKTDYFQKILFGPYPQGDFIHLEAGEIMRQEMIIDP